ncbi:hypothetical protein [Succinimonas sp.]|uniref:hypothetical protein n=1 Tax=Succinimonas sp. TaxID=1936151 RepID=UPI00386BCC09
MTENVTETEDVTETVTATATVNTNLSKVKIIQAASASALETAVNTYITEVNTAGTSAVTDVKYDVERLPGENVYTALVIECGITNG